MQEFGSFSVRYPMLSHISGGSEPPLTWKSAQFGPQLRPSHARHSGFVDCESYPYLNLQ